MRHQTTKRNDKIPKRMPNAMLVALEVKVLYAMMMTVCTIRSRMMIHIKTRRRSTRVVAVPPSDQDLAYSPGPRQLRDFQDPSPVVPSWSMVTTGVVMYRIECLRFRVFGLCFGTVLL